jgi:hypothetical protein
VGADMHKGPPDTWGESPEPRFVKERTEDEIDVDIERGFLCPSHRAEWDFCDCAFTPAAAERYGKTSSAGGEAADKTRESSIDSASQPPPARTSQPPKFG